MAGSNAHTSLQIIRATGEGCSNVHEDEVCWLPRWAQANKVRHEQMEKDSKRQENPNLLEAQPLPC